MIDSESNFFSTQSVQTSSVKKVFSRKQLTQWIDKQTLTNKQFFTTKITPENLKNGVFFLFILQKIYPEDFILSKSKANLKPVSDYDMDKNLQIVKKILNKYKLQINLNVSQILKSKNNFDLLNWFKNLNDGLFNTPQITKANSIKQINDSIALNDDYYNSDIKKTINSNNSTSKKLNYIQKKLSNIQKSKQKQIEERQQNKVSIISSGYRTNRESSALKACQKPLSQQKRQYSTLKLLQIQKQKPTKNLVQTKDNLFKKENTINRQNNRSQLNMSQNDFRRVNQPVDRKQTVDMSQFDSVEDFNQSLYQLALEQSIYSFGKILQNVRQRTLNTQNVQSFQTYIHQIQKAIYQKN